MTDSELPEGLADQVAILAARAAAGRRPLAPMPVVVISARARRSRVVDLGRRGEASRVVLAGDLLLLPAAEREFPIAHELAHVLRHQEGAARLQGRWHLLGSRALPLATLLLPLVASVAVRHGHPWAVSAALTLLPLLLAAMVGTRLHANAVARREETAADELAGSLFGASLTETGVARLARQEGALSRRLPALLRTHPQPHLRGQPVAGDPGPRSATREAST